MTKTKQIGRPPKIGSLKISKTVSIDQVKLKRIEKRFGSLTKYIAAKLLADNI